jgi:hypothetical protein
MQHITLVPCKVLCQVPGSPGLSMSVRIRPICEGSTYIHILRYAEPCGVHVQYTLLSYYGTGNDLLVSTASMYMLLHRVQV